MGDETTKAMSEQLWRDRAERAEARAADLESAARRWYEADGTVVEHLSAEEVVLRRKAAAVEAANLRDRVKALEVERIRQRKEIEDLQLRLVEIRHRVAQLRRDPQDQRVLVFGLSFTEREIRQRVDEGTLDVALDFIRETFLLDLQRLLTTEGA